AFTDISAVEAFLRELAERPAGPLVMGLPRQSGSRENRWAHMLSGAPIVQESAVAPSASDAGGLAINELAAVKANVARLESEVSELKAMVAKLCTELGIRTS
ncbi:MAG TPA: DUF480 domain-containing protein, partial [Burkholderiales bacterium]|nr:DUF480 domain-containing protein [Burkholderiales bacterium]